MPSVDFSASYAGRCVCVTGGAGFIGSHLCRALLDHGAQVCVIDDLSNGLEANLADLTGDLCFVRGSILDPVALEQAITGAEIVFHQAAVASVPLPVTTW